MWFVHATDPDIFLPDAQSGDKSKKDVGVRQEELNAMALSDMLKRIGSLPEGDGPPMFLVLTGGFGVDPCAIGKGGNPSSTPTPVAQSTPQSRGETTGDGDKHNQSVSSAKDCVDAVDSVKRENQIKVIADILGESPVQNIYLVAGNNDIALESADDAGIKYFNQFIDAVQAKLIASKSGVLLHNLTRCYASGENPTTCFADIPTTDYRLIGFPSYSFAKQDEKGQTKQFEIFRQLTDDAQRAGKKLLVVSHSPEMDDPYLLARARYVNPTTNPTVTLTPGESASPAQKESEGRETRNQSESADENAQSSSTATWKVSDDLLKHWKDVIASGSVMGVLAGHLHDSHKQIYQRPYTQSSGSYSTFCKLFLAPPLAVKNQDKSPIQARGFSLIHLQPDHIASRLYWYNSETRQFTLDPQSKHRVHEHGFCRWVPQCSRIIIAWLWSLENDAPLVRMAVLLIAFLTAFLTIVAIWQIPPANDPFADEKRTAQDASKPAQTTPNAASDSSPYSNKFGKTVIAGLGGLVAAEVTKSLGNQQPSPDTRWFYIVWFIIFFFLLLLSLNVWRAAVEALRAWVAVGYYPLSRVGSITKWDAFKHWLSSLRVPLLTFLDTFINLIQGKNQTRTRVFEKTIIDYHWNVIRVADKIRLNLNQVIEGRVRQERQKKAAQVSLADLPDLVRVNVSVLSKDQSSVYYISRDARSSRLPFRKRSIAWVSVFTGENRWYQSTYGALPDFDKIVLFNNAAGVIPDADATLLLKDYYQARSGEDYHAFVVLPFPSLRGGFGIDYVKGAIHVSFREESDLAYIWQDPTIATKLGLPPNYDTPRRVLENWCPDDGVRAAVRSSIAILGELLRGFNETIYKNYIEPNQPD